VVIPIVQSNNVASSVFVMKRCGKVKKEKEKETNQRLASTEGMISVTGLREEDAWKEEYESEGLVGNFQLPSNFPFRQ